ncbi:MULTISPECIES: hypothetical protein [Bacillus]|uniref:Anti-sigma factor n=2 Tax=Bacillus TaxID=1386 RepID=A0A0M4G6N5_9BACI|nr:MULTISPECIES: hypothetical protein [Bacillus]ALC80570.1 anti-sigma factor [Bacillus gobiensis]MBP1083658.1 hypothetical protein [Bacillus capparidis]MED1094850.1 anti-sigma factor [Bacillus capparidis]
MELVKIFKEHNVFGWISCGTAVISLLLLNLAILSDVTYYTFQAMPFSMAAIPLGIIELIIKKGRTGPGILGIILNVFVIACIYTIASININLNLTF